jgi:hypothetical protein
MTERMQFESRVGTIILTSPYHPDGLWDPLNLLFSEYRWLFHWGVEWQEPEADHSPPTSAKVYASIPPHAFMA